MNEFSLMPITIGIIALTVLISFLAFNNQELRNKLIFYPAGMHNSSEYYRFLGHGLIHADYIHLFFNMYTLYSFGRFAEIALFTKVQYILLYITALVAASVFDFVKNRQNSSYAALGASGAVSAVVFACIIVDPWVSGISLFGIIKIPNILFGVLYLSYCMYMSKRGHDNIGHNAHFWGSVYGFAFAAVMRPDLLQRFIEQLTHPSFN